jgi:hypothetical protein
MRQPYRRSKCAQELNPCHALCVPLSPSRRYYLLAPLTLAAPWTRLLARPAARTLCLSPALEDWPGVTELCLALTRVLLGTPSRGVPDGGPAVTGHWGLVGVVSEGSMTD